ncbi:MAG: efflux RND transporter periplasmic adaptor subunit, partial [Gammaproteobacteria bacterium]|nr:efflux RND transporter periplasmic adaptor subunit [Gammaproteobacteria bacterium]
DQVRVQNKAAVYVDGRRIESTAITFYPSAEPQTNTFRARIELPKDLQGLAPGMFVKVGFVTGELQRLLVPRSAIVERSEMRAVYVVAGTAGYRCGR